MGRGKVGVKVKRFVEVYYRRFDVHFSSSSPALFYVELRNYHENYKLLADAEISADYIAFSSCVNFRCFKGMIELYYLLYSSKIIKNLSSFEKPSFVFALSLGLIPRVVCYNWYRTSRNCTGKIQK